MELVHLAEVDSTSTQAARLLAAGKRPPFAVWADVQTGGRGRRGNVWLSPAGNLYLTLVLPPPRGLTPGWLPLRAGAAVARLVKRHAGLRLTLKWPNDLLFAGRKLGGLLLEGSLSGSEPGDVLIGLGLNVARAPALAGDYAACALRDIGGDATAADWAQRLAAGFQAEWDALASAALTAAAYAEFAIPAGDLWRFGADGPDTAPPGPAATTAAGGGRHGAAGTPAAARPGRGDAYAAAPGDDVAAGGGRHGAAGTPAAARPGRGDAYAAARGLRDDAALELAPLGGGAALSLTSADHGWRWLYQGARGPVPLAVADVGNSAIKIAYFADARDAAPAAVWVAPAPRGGESGRGAALPPAAGGGAANPPAPAVGAAARAPGELAAALAALAALLPAKPWPLHVLSVNPPAAAVLAAAAAAAGLSATPIPKRPVRRHGDGYAFGELGADRLAAVEGWLATAAAQGAGAARPPGFAVVVASGTATTIDAVTTAGRHLGGLILPGPATALASLHRAASLLPEVEAPRQDPGAPTPDLGHDTRSAMSEAVLAMAAGAVQRAQAAAARLCGLPLAPGGLVVTGGWGRALAARLGAGYDDSLVLTGARAMVLGGWLPSREVGHDSRS